MSELTEQQWKDIVSHVTELGRKRRRILGDSFHEVDFVAGAMTVMQAIGVPMNEMPASWIVGPLSGQPIFREEE